MEWMQIKELLNRLENEYINLFAIQEYISNDKNYETENKKVYVTLFYFVKAIKKKLEEIPKNIDEIREIIMKYGNDTNKIIEILKGLCNDFDNLNKSITILKTITEISDKTYEYEGGYENSLSFKSYMNFNIKALEVCQNDEMSISEKYDYMDSFDKDLSCSEKGELLVQSFIGKTDEKKQNEFLMGTLFKLVNDDNPYKKIEDYYRCILEARKVAEDKLDEMKLENQLMGLSPILESPYVKLHNKSKSY